MHLIVRKCREADFIHDDSVEISEFNPEISLNFCILQTDSEERD